MLWLIIRPCRNISILKFPAKMERKVFRVMTNRRVSLISMILFVGPAFFGFFFPAVITGKPAGPMPRQLPGAKSSNSMAVEFPLVQEPSLSSRSDPKPIPSAKSRLRIAGAQIPVTENVSANLATISRAIDFALSNKADILLTPEGSLSGYFSEFDATAVSQAL